jgi:hypothetical protein
MMGTTARTTISAANGTATIQTADHDQAGDDRQQGRQPSGHVPAHQAVYQRREQRNHQEPPTGRCRDPQHLGSD